MVPKRKVFISYARKDSTRAEVGELVRWLKGQEGIEVISDHLFPYKAPLQGWYSWMQQSIEAADIVLCICGKKFKEGFEKKGGGVGVAFEGGLLTSELCKKGGLNKKIHPILPAVGAFQYVPEILSAWNNDIALSQRKRILGLIREQTDKLPPLLEPPRRPWKAILTAMGVLVAVLGVSVAMVYFEPNKDEPRKDNLAHVEPINNEGSVAAIELEPQKSVPDKEARLSTTLMEAEVDSPRLKLQPLSSPQHSKMHMQPIDCTMPASFWTAVMERKLSVYTQQLFQLWKHELDVRMDIHGDFKEYQHRTRTSSGSPRSCKALSQDLDNWLKSYASKGQPF